MRFAPLFSSAGGEESTQRSFNTLRASLFEYCGRRKYAKKLQCASRLSFRVLWEKKVRKEASIRFAPLFSNTVGEESTQRSFNTLRAFPFECWGRRKETEKNFRRMPFDTRRRNGSGTWI
jgi:hypothetical protein